MCPHIKHTRTSSRVPHEATPHCHFQGCRMALRTRLTLISEMCWQGTIESSTGKCESAAVPSTFAPLAGSAGDAGSLRGRLPALFEWCLSDDCFTLPASIVHRHSPPGTASGVFLLLLYVLSGAARFGGSALPRVPAEDQRMTTDKHSQSIPLRFLLSACAIWAAFP